MSWRRISLALVIVVAAAVLLFRLRQDQPEMPVPVAQTPPPETPAPVSQFRQVSTATVLRTNAIRQPTQAQLLAGETIEIFCRIRQPSQVPPNGQVQVTWRLADQSEKDSQGRSADIEKALHALDPDMFVVFRAPVSGTYELAVSPQTSRDDTAAVARWREPTLRRTLYDHDLGAASPPDNAWPDGASVTVETELRPCDVTTARNSGMVIEAEPNDVAELAQQLPLGTSDSIAAVHVLGGSDDIEYFDNDHVGEAGDDWFRIDYSGEQERLLTACLSIPDQQVVSRIRCYSLTAEEATLRAGQPLSFSREYTAGKNPNERVHQQKEPHRIAINRRLRPGNVYFLRVESNAPAYDLHVQIVEPAPYDDPHRAIARGLYDHIGQVDAWLANRPRSVSVERRIRDTGNLLGSGCMSCHTQAGVWGPAVAFANGYRPQNAQLMRHLVNLCYQSMRPTNELIDAANNASLAPLDLGDGPAGTRVTGHAAVAYGRYRPPRQLHSRQAIRAANNVLQTADPSAVNAAGPGANVGQGVVLNYAAEILLAAWEATDEPKYFRALEDRARAALTMKPKFTDDICHRIELLTRFFPEAYIEAAAKVALRETSSDYEPIRVPYASRTTSPDEASALAGRISQQIVSDLQRLRAIQNDDGSWGFAPGKLQDSTEGQSHWSLPQLNPGEPSPTALALVAFESAGESRDDAHVSSGVKALLKMQKPTGLWKGESLTGFVSTGYALSALSRLYPVEPAAPSAQHLLTEQPESLLDTVGRMRAIAMAENPELIPTMSKAIGHHSPFVRYWAAIGLGYVMHDDTVAPLVRSLGDRSKLVREAAIWALRQQLIDDRGWDTVLEACRSKDDAVRSAAMQTLVMRVDGVLPGISVEWAELTNVLAHGMNHDPHPAVRAWAMRAAWNWWYWNPPVRPALNHAWVELLGRAEHEAVVERAMRYQTHALFIVNGHHANASRTHQYPELAELFALLQQKLVAADGNAESRARLVRRLVGIAATFYGTAGGDGGPGQMGYATPGASELFGQAFLDYFSTLESNGTANDAAHELLHIGLEGAANIPHEELQQRLIHYSLNGPDDLRTIAATSVSDPRSAQLVAVPEMIEPLMRQVHRGAMDAPRRSQLSDPIVQLFRRVRWMVPVNSDQRREILEYLVPALNQYKSREQIRQVTDPGRRQELDRRASADQYLAEKLGDVLATNPDLHFDEVLDRFPTGLVNPLEARFWLPSVPWILGYSQPLPALDPTAAIEESDDTTATVRQRALELYLAQLSPDAERSTRELAIGMCNNTVLRSRPEVLAAIAALVEAEQNPTLARLMRNVLSISNELPRLLASALQREEPRRAAVGADDVVEVSPEFLVDFQYFRDHVIPEMNQPQREDQQSCFSCHGVPERVPPLTLKAPDRNGYLSVTNLLANYRLLQGRIDYDETNRSKLLRKPLNIQSGQEDGHQGGLRYRPDQRGYLVLKRWVESQINLGPPDGSQTETD